MTPDDICFWPDETWCFYSDILDFEYMGDDYEVIPFGTDRWDELVL